MSAESVLLVGRETRATGEVLATHADRIRERGLVDAIEVATYEHELVRELKSQFEAHDSDRVYAVQMCTAHTYETTAEYHAARLREHSDYGEMVPCYLLQNPAIECVRYNVSNDSAVAVPLFVSRSAARLVADASEALHEYTPVSEA